MNKLPQVIPDCHQATDATTKTNKFRKGTWNVTTLVES